jgi:hypothetical protein
LRHRHCSAYGGELSLNDVCVMAPIVRSVVFIRCVIVLAILT